MLKPSRRTYALGRALLEGLSFDYRRGFNASGRPRDVLPLSLIARERVMPRYHLGLVNRSAMLRHNTLQLTRTYPDGFRQDSSNLDPSLAWSMGCHMVSEVR